MIDFLRRSWAVVNLDNIAYNYKSIRSKLSDNCMIMGVVKADGYGHGDRFIAQELVCGGVDWFGVSNIDEALSLRQYEINKPILIFGPTPVRLAGILINQNLTQTVHSSDYAKALQTASENANGTVDVHIKIDTGMSRLGFSAFDENFGTALNQIKEVFDYKNINIGGAFTHFAVADELNDISADFTKMQFNRFIKACETLEKDGRHFPIKHCCNSAAVMNYPEMQLDMVRPGIITYGLYPSDDCQGGIDIKPAMELFSSVSMVKNIKKGTSLSYGRIFTAEKDMRIATIAIGYADGYERGLSNRARMIVGGEYAPVVGRVCMDQLMVDVTDIPSVKEGDSVIVVGEYGDKSVTFDELAGFTGTVNYEKCCLIGRRVPRIYVKNGKEVGVADYIRKDMKL